MPNHDLELLTYLNLAALSQRKRQLLGSDKLLVLAGAAACQAGCLTVAERCREVVVAHHPRHVLSRFTSFPDALRSDDFAPLLRRLKKLCTFEAAELLAREWDVFDESFRDRTVDEVEAEALRLLTDFAK